MWRIFKFAILSLAAVLLLCLAVAWWLIEDGDWIRDEAGAFVTELTGRDFSIEGPLDIGISAHPTVTAGNLRLANAPWADGDDMIRLQRLRVSFELFSIFSDQFIIHFIEADGLSVALAENEQGEANWDLFPGEQAEGDEPMDKWPISLGRLSLNEFSLSHDAPDRVEPLDFSLAELKAVRLEGERVELDGNGSLGGLPLTIAGRAGPLNHLIIGGGMDIKIDLSLGEIDLNIDGHVADALTGKGADLTFNFSGPEFTWLTHRFDIPDFSSGPFDFDLLIDSEGNRTKIDLVTVDSVQLHPGC